MTSIEQYRCAAVNRSVTRQVSRTLSRIDGNTNIDLAKVESRADIQAAQVDAITAVTQRGLQGAAFITNVEMSLAEACPASMSRLKAIGDVGTMMLGQIVMDTAYKLRRI